MKIHYILLFPIYILPHLSAKSKKHTCRYMNILLLFKEVQRKRQSIKLLGKLQVGWVKQPKDIYIES